MESSLDAYVISTEEAIARGSTAGEVSAVANYHIRKHQTLKASLNRLHQRNKGRPSADISSKIKQVEREMKTTTFVVDALVAVARNLRKIGRIL